MQVSFELFPNFLRNTFSRTRSYLVGKSIVEQNRQLQGDQVEFAQKLTTPIVTLDFSPQIQEAPQTKKKQKKQKKQRSFWQRMLDSFLLTVMFFSFLVAGILFIPQAYYQFFPADTQPMESLEKSSAWGGEFEQPVANQKQITLPPQDESLPAGDWLIIPRIGVRTKIQSGMSPEEALKTGVWMASEYGQAGADNGLPIILAAHRFGWKWWWQTDYWKYNSFYNLPKIEPGDLVEIISDKRKWTYEIYAGEEGEKITDYEADIILYTCKFLNSPVRYFRYARLIDLKKDTQS